MREWMSEQQKCIRSPVSLWGNVRKVTAFTNTAANSLITRGNYQNSSSFSTHMLPSNLHLYTSAPQSLQISLLNRLLSRSSPSTPSASYFYPAPTLFGDTSTSKVFFVFLCSPVYSPSVTRYCCSIRINVFSPLCSLCLVFPRPRGSFELAWLSLFVWLTSFLEGLTRVTRHRPAARATTKALLLGSHLRCVCACLSVFEWTLLLSN